MKQFKKLDYDKHPIYINCENETELNTRLNSCKREPDTVNWVESFEINSIFFDIGANIGAYSLIAASTKKNIQVFAFEPHSYNFTTLVSNIYENKFSNTITPINMGVSNISLLSTLYHWDKYPLGESGSSGHQLNNIHDHEGLEFNPIFQQSILSISIDNFIREYNIHPNYIKIDVDGIEKLIIQGMTNLIMNQNSLISILVECNGDSGIFIDNFMNCAGFKKTIHSRNNNILYTKL
jgi:FkbM family methyltransferase